MSRFGAEFIVASAEVLHERVSVDDHAGGVVGFEAAHWFEPRFESTLSALDSVIRVLLGVVHRAGQQVRDHVRQRRRAVGDDLVRWTMCEHRRREEPPSCGDVATRSAM